MAWEPSYGGRWGYFHPTAADPMGQLAHAILYPMRIAGATKIYAELRHTNEVHEFNTEEEAKQFCEATLTLHGVIL